MPRKYQKAKRIPIVTFKIYSLAAQAAAPACLWLAQVLPDLLDHLARLTSPKGRQATARITTAFARLHQALEAEQAAAADYRVPPTFKKCRSPYHLEAVVAHPSAAAVIRFLADLDEVGLKWDWRHHREAASGFNVWYVDKTNLWAGYIAGLTKTVNIYWQPFRLKETPKPQPVRPTGPRIAAESKMKEESYV